MADLKLSLILRAVDKGAKQLIGSTKAGVAGLTAENKKAAGVQKLVTKATNDTNTAEKKAVGVQGMVEGATKRTTGAVNKETAAVTRFGVASEVAGKRAKSSLLGTALGVARGSAMLVTAVGLMAALAAGAAAVIVPAALFKFGEAKAKEFADLGREADAAGMSIAKLQELQTAFTLNGKDKAGAADLYNSLSTSAGKAWAGGKHEAEMFRSIGVAVRDQNGKLRPTAQLLEEAADGYAKIKTQQKKAIIAQGIFGGSVEDLNAVLKDGSAGLRDYAMESRRNGQVSDQGRRDAHAANQSYVRMTEAIRGLVNVASEKLLPIITQVTDVIGAWFRDPGNRANILKSLTEAANQLVKALPKLLPLIPQLMDAALKLVTQTDWQKAADDLGEVANAVMVLAKAIGFLAKVGGVAINVGELVAGNRHPRVDQIIGWDQLKKRKAKESAARPATAAPAKGSVDVNIHVRQDGPPKVTTRTSGDLAVAAYRGGS